MPPAFYRLQTAEGFRWIEPSNREDAKLFRRLSRESSASWWTPPALIWMSDQHKRPISDFPASSWEVLCLSEKAHSVLSPMIAPACEQLVFDGLSGAPYRLFNVIRTLDCLDTDRTEFARTPSGKNIGPKHVALRSTIVADHDLFGIDEHLAYLFVSQRFKDAVHKAGLTGFSFQPCELT